MIVCTKNIISAKWALSFFFINLQFKFLCAKGKGLIKVLVKIINGLET